MQRNLADIFFAQFSQGGPVSAKAERSQVEAALAQLLAAARAAWPDVVLTDDAFVTWIAHRHRESTEASLADLASLDGPGLYLACACAQGDRRALAHFEQTHLPQITRLLAHRMGRSMDIDEVVQGLRTKLFVGSGNDGEPPKITAYRGQGALAGWLKVVAVRLALNGIRADVGRKQVSLPGELAAGTSFENELLKGTYRKQVSAAIKHAFSSLSQEERALLRSHFGDGHEIQELARRAGVHRMTISRRLATARERLAEAVRGKLQAELALSGSDAQSMIAFVHSQLGASLSGLLGSGTRSTRHSVSA